MLYSQMFGRSVTHFNNYFYSRVNIASTYELTVMYEHCDLTVN